MKYSNISSDNIVQIRPLKENPKLIKKDWKFWLMLKFSYVFSILIWFVGTRYFKLHSPSLHIKEALSSTIVIFVLIILPTYLILYRFINRFTSGEKLIRIIFSALLFGSVIYGLTLTYKQEKKDNASLRDFINITHKHKSQSDIYQDLKVAFHKELEFLITERMQAKYLANKEERHKNYLLILKIKEINQEFYNAYNNYQNKILIDISSHATEWNKDFTSGLYERLNHFKERMIHMQETYISFLELVLSLNEYLDTIGSSIEVNGDHILFRNNENLSHYYDITQKIEEHFNLIIQEENENILTKNNAIEKINQLKQYCFFL